MSAWVVVDSFATSMRDPCLHEVNGGRTLRSRAGVSPPTSLRRPPPTYRGPMFDTLSDRLDKVFTSLRG